MKHPAALVLHSLGDAGSRGATCSAEVALATQVESLRNPAKPRDAILSSIAISATEDPPCGEPQGFLAKKGEREN